MSDERQEPDHGKVREEPDHSDSREEPDRSQSRKEPDRSQSREEPDRSQSRKEPDRSESREEPDRSESREAAEPGGARERRPPPRAKGGRRGRADLDPERPCMNCGDPTPGEYCPTCGQRKVDAQVSVRTMVMDVLEDQFILDRRLPRTLGALLFKPGFLTVEHVNGRIVRYIHPFRLYLVTSILFFLLLSFLSLRLVRQAMVDDSMGALTRVDTTDAVAIDSALAAVDATLADTASVDIEELPELERIRATLRRQRRDVHLDSLAGELDRVDSALATVRRGTTDTTLPAGVRSALVETGAGLEVRRAVMTARIDSLRADSAGIGPRPDQPRRTLAEALGWDGSPPQTDFGVAVVDSVVAGQLRRLGTMEPREAAETLLGTFFNYVPTMMFILLPVFAAVLKLLYIRRRRYYAEHFVFLLHVHSFVFLLATVMLLLRRWVAGWLELALSAWILVYILLAMKRVYGQGWLKTFVKYWTLGWMYFWILSISIPIAIVAALLLF
jgi:hypothetical protein